MVDLFQVAEILRKESPEDFEVLCRVPATFETKDLTRPQPAWYENSKTHIEVDYFGNVSNLNLKSNFYNIGNHSEQIF